MNIKTFEQFSEAEEKILGMDLDGVLNNFIGGFNAVYKKHFPDGSNVIDPDKVFDWNWWMEFNYGDQNPFEWFKNQKAETWLYSNPFRGAIETMKTIYTYTQNNGIILIVVTSQMTKEAEKMAVDWLRKHDIKYDDISFVYRSKDKWDHADVMVDDSPYVLNSKPKNRVSIKLNQNYNIGVKADFNVDSIRYLTPYIIKKAFEKYENIRTI